RHRAHLPRGPASAALRPARNGARARARYDDHGRADDQRGQTRREAPLRRVDRSHQGPLAVGAVGAYGPRDRARLRGPDARRGRPRLTVAPSPQPSAAAVPPLIDRAALDRALRADTTAVGPFREALRQASERLAERFKRNDPIETLVRARAEIVDQIILASWLNFAEELAESADLVAVGGYAPA